MHAQTAATESAIWPCEIPWPPVIETRFKEAGTMDSYRIGTMHRRIAAYKPFTTILGAVVATALVMAVAPARAEKKPPVPLFSFPRVERRLSVATRTGRQTRVMESTLQIQQGGVRALAQTTDALELSIAVPDQPELVARVARAPLLASDLHITATQGPDGRETVDLPIHPTILKGYLLDDPMSAVAFVVLDGQVFGIASDADHLWFMQPAQRNTTRASEYVLRDLAIETRGQESAFCGSDDLPQNKLAEQALRSQTTETVPDYGTRLRFKLALDCDYPFVHNLFHDDAAAASAYTLLLAALASTIIERDVNVTLTVSYINLWTTSSPYGSYQENTPVCTVLTRFGSYWDANRTSVQRDLAYLVTGVPAAGGGCTYLNGLCSPSGIGYAACFIAGLFPGMPNNESNADLFNFTHELGHSLGSPHTQSCFWQSSGLLPPHATIDTCVVAEEGCNSGPVARPPGKGTLMSYCGVNPFPPPGERYYDQVTKLEFHQLCRDLMRSVVLGKPCLTADPIQPPSDLQASANPACVVLVFTPPNNAGVIRYDIYRSSTSLDLAPPLVASTTSTIWVDLAPIGMTDGVFYRVKVVTTSGQSGFSNEAGTAYCVPWQLNTFALGLPIISSQQLTPKKICVADLNDDELPDVVVAGGSHFNALTDPPGRLRLLYNTGNTGSPDETFVSGPLIPTVALPCGVVVDDFNDDGIADIAVLGASSANLYVHLGQGANGVSAGTYAAPVEYFPGANVTDMVAADVNADGIRDLLVSGFAGFSVLLGNGSGGVGDGTFADPVVYGPPVEDYLGGLTVLDANEDGILDVACTDVTQNRVYVFAGLGSGGVGNGTFTSSPASATCGPAPTSISHADMNRDGIEDLVVAHSGAASVGVLLGNGTGGVGDGTFQGAVSYPTSFAPAKVSIGDWFTDGNPDVLIAESGPATEIPSNGVLHNLAVGFLLGNALGGSANGTLTGAVHQKAVDGPVDAVSDDVNGDGIADVLAVGSRSAGLGLLYGTCHRTLNYSIAVLAPNGSESLVTGTNSTIRWTHGKGIGQVNVDLSRNGGTDWERLRTAVSDTFLVWRVVAPLSSTARIRVSDARVSTAEDLSNANFSIVAAGPPQGMPSGDPVATRIKTAGLSVIGAGRMLLRVQLSKPVEQEGWLELFDVNGRRLTRAQVGGAQSAVESQIVSGSGPGVYFLRFHQSGVTDSRRLVLLP